MPGRASQAALKAQGRKEEDGRMVKAQRIVRV
jgi:hypothetical protein